MSDQDFFFDEEEAPATEKTSAGEKPSAKQPAKGLPPKASQSKTGPSKGATVAPPAGGIELTWTITALIGVVALLLGVIVGYAIPKNSTGTVTGSPVQSAPQLTPEQVQTGELPEGHPDIGAMTGGSGAATESAPATGN